MGWIELEWGNMIWIGLERAGIGWDEGWIGISQNRLEQLVMSVMGWNELEWEWFGMGLVGEGWIVWEWVVMDWSQLE